jgi:hypothetical protein
VLALFAHDRDVAQRRFILPFATLPECKFIRTISSRNEILEGGHPLFNVIADATGGCQLCVVIVELYQEQRTIGRIGFRGLKHANLAIPNVHKRNYFRFAFRNAQELDVGSRNAQLAE